MNAEKRYIWDNSKEQKLSLVELSKSMSRSRKYLKYRHFIPPIALLTIPGTAAIFLGRIYSSQFPLENPLDLGQWVRGAFIASGIQKHDAQHFRTTGEVNIVEKPAQSGGQNQQIQQTPDKLTQKG